MATYRQLPEVFRKLHPRFKTPWLSLVVFAGFVLDPRAAARARSTSSARCTRSARCCRSRSRTPSIIQLRREGPRTRSSRTAARPNLRIGGVDWPLFAFSAGTATGLAWLVVVVQDAPTRYAGLGWLAIGLRRVRRLPPTGAPRAAHRDGAAPPCFGPAIALEYRTIIVPVVAGEQAREAMHLAARLAAERRVDDRRHARDRRAARPAARTPTFPSRRRSPTSCSTRRTTSATSTASGSSSASSAAETPAPRSSPRRSGETPRSSSWARRGCLTARARARSSARRPTTCCATPPVA